MSRWTRRDLLKRALAATAGTVAANPLPAAPDARAPLDASTRSGPAGFDQVGRHRDQAKAAAVLCMAFVQTLKQAR